MRCSYVNKLQCPIESNTRWCYETWLANYKLYENENENVHENSCYSLYSNSKNFFTGDEASNLIKNIQLDI
jgi:hypothetical protein